ncbi:dephospho-CoA kinase [Maribacter halichondriae]|uniref:dephospho-CoA kinase n=1 Tax=Maribacter halichondriae TaxID=2980554 RepID=UPI00307649FE
MFENGLQDFYDKVILITAPKELRLHRILKRDQTSKEVILTRMGAQWDDAKKIPLSDFVIENVDLEKTKSKIEYLHKRLLEYS